MAISLLNIFLMFVSAGVAYLFPLDLLIFSYAFLGPAHYLTEISWLHDRGYFATEKRDVWFLFLLSVGAMLGIGVVGAFDVAILSAFVLAFFLVRPMTPKTKVLLAVLTVGSWSLLRFYLEIGSLLATFMVTIIHVYLFTGIFILAGALKRKSWLDFVSLLAYVTLPFGLVISSSGLDYDFSQISDAESYRYFSGLTGQIHSLFSLSSSGSVVTATFAFLSFAYTYHYLNWFSKTRIIGWHETSVHRLIWIGFLYVVSIGAYLVDYKLGFTLLLFLSVLHVVLEFPLNHRSFQSIASELRSFLPRGRR